MKNITHKKENQSKLLDAKDRKVLSALFNDARSPFSTIAKKARISKESANYRVKRLAKEGFLVGFNTVVDVKKLGWNMFFVYIRFRKIDVEQESIILGYLAAHPNVAQVFRCLGNYDALIKVFVREAEDVDVLMKGIESRFKENMDSYGIDFIVDETAVPFSFLYKPDSNRIYRMEKSEGKTQLSPIERKLLKLLAKDARLPIADAARKLHTSRDIVSYHLKKLQEEGVILKFRPDLLTKRIGYSWYFLILKTEKLTPSINAALESFLLSHPNVTYVYRSVRNSDVQVEIRALNNEELNDIVIEIRGILKNVLNRAELLVILDEQKYTYFPQCMENEQLL
jgi:DNA-binding Lrp family transcriptional regulator